MAENEPVAPVPAGEPSTTPRVTGATGPDDGTGTYWLSAPRRNGRTTIVPVLGVWLDGALHLAVSQTMHAPEPLGATADCAVTTDPRGMELVVRGVATRVLDPAALSRLAGVFTARYDSPFTLDDTTFRTGGDTPCPAGPSPYDVYKVTPTPPTPSANASPSGTPWSL
ncbi:hypothetical protein GCM10009677_29270 [Sphaerisporangium rubeum]|uniref:Pyridoxamine 5'-phosphate oxidase n=1 Tax=Sphaerisporangium rubeum TaxID=321317 RepID=A0A7X0M6H9_9ACTN|nr:hypothetical protein [Sphaerisporangium rubeum]MBB6473733.1 hypothetical protein [Sphaerisporangium rubeum]